jgi:hypothetical protein
LGAEKGSEFNKLNDTLSKVKVDTKKTKSAIDKIISNWETTNSTNSSAFLPDGSDKPIFDTFNDIKQRVYNIISDPSSTARD